MQGSALGLAALQRGVGLHDPTIPSLPTVIPEMPSTRGVPVHLPSLRDHPEELRCCCSPFSSSSPLLPFPPEEAGPDPCACPLSFLPREQPLGFSLSQGGWGEQRGQGGCPQSLHSCSIPCVSDAVSSRLLLLPPGLFYPLAGSCGGLLSHLPKTPAPGPGSHGVVSGGGFSIPSPGNSGWGPRVPWD